MKRQFIELLIMDNTFPFLQVFTTWHWQWLEGDTLDKFSSLRYRHKGIPWDHIIISFIHNHWQEFLNYRVTRTTDRGQKSQLSFGFEFWQSWYINKIRIVKSWGCKGSRKIEPFFIKRKASDWIFLIVWLERWPTQREKMKQGSVCKSSACIHLQYWLSLSRLVSLDLRVDNSFEPQFI